MSDATFRESSSASAVEPASIVRAVSAALPWIVFPLVVIWRGRRSRSLMEESAQPPVPAPLVSVIVPARDEERNIERCLRSVLSSDYPALEVVMVDDHSADRTALIARTIAAEDPRLRVIDNAPLPADWFGKQWACATGASAARGEILCFADADTVHAPDLVTRTVNAIQSRRADLLSVVGRQELGSFWERVVQPHIFAILAGRYGSTEHVGESRHASEKIANGQCLWITRAAYERVGGHAAVRHTVAEDLLMAQRVFEAGMRVAMVLGLPQLSTRMYTSLREIVRGWRKNIFAGGREAAPGGALGRALYALLLPLPALVTLLPPAALALGAIGAVSEVVTLFGVIAVSAQLLWWIYVYRTIGLSPLYALTFPLGGAVLLGISAQSVARGRHVSWKGRAYVSR